MTIKDWVTHLPTTQDVLVTDQPDLVNDTVPGDGTGDLTRAKQLHALRDKIDYCANKIGSDLVEAGSIRSYMATSPLTKMKFTAEGGLAVLLTNKTGLASVRGSVVEAGTLDNSFSLCDTSSDHAFGAVYDSGIADGSECWVVVAGRCQVLLQNSTSATRRYWVRSSAVTAGRATANTAAPPGGAIGAIDNHFAEIGHCIESKIAGTNVLAYIMMHFL